MKSRFVAAALGVFGLCVVPGLAMAGSGAGAIVLSFPIGARYNALGEAGTALAQDAASTWYNPGGLAFMADHAERHDLQFMQSPLASGLANDIALYWGGYASRTGSGGYGVSFTYLDMGTQVATDEQGQEIGTFSSYEFVFQGNYAFRLSPNLGLGMAAKYFRDKLADDQFLQDKTGGSGSSFGIDLGMLWKVPTLKMNFAAALSNLGPDITHVDADQSDPMPRKFTAGFAWGLVQSQYMGVILVGDYQLPIYNWKGNDYGFGFEPDQDEWGVGAEWQYDHSLFLRAGWKSANYGDITDYTFGFGVDLKKWVKQAIVFDFASVPQATGLDRVNRFSLGYRW
jgi:hypothetical protein